MGLSPEKLRTMLEQIKAGGLDIDQAMEQLKNLPYEDLGFATIDHHRALRQGTAEVIFCQNKTTYEIVEIMKRLHDDHQPVMATRAKPEAFEELKTHFPQAIFYERSRVITLGARDEEGIGHVLVICAGTSDLHVAEEAVVTSRFTGSKTSLIADVGVAGLHRLLHRLDVIRSANVLVVVAGMEGALASVVGGLVSSPVIGVPTSVGYGASFNGVSALLSMLNSCSAGVTVVNIDNGFGAGYAASLINKRICGVEGKKK